MINYQYRRYLSSKQLILNFKYQLMDPNTPIQMQELSYEELQQPPQLNEELLLKIDTAIRSSNWTDNHQCITCIRSINKHFPQFTPDMILKYGASILELISNGKTQILKNIFKLLKQIYCIGQQINVSKAVEGFLPILLKKAATDIGHMKQRAQQVLTTFSSNCGYGVSFTVTCSYCVDKNNHIAELSLKLLAQLVKNTGNAFTSLQPDALKIIMYTLLTIINGKRANMKTWALDICLLIYKMIGSNNYLDLMKFSLNEEQIKIMGSNMQMHRVSKQKQLRLSTVLKERRKTILVNNQNCQMSGNFNNNFNGGNSNSFYR